MLLQGILCGKNQEAFLETHQRLIRNGKMVSSVSHHVGLYHGFDANSVRFFAIEHVECSTSTNKCLLLLETKWIFQLEVMILTKLTGIDKNISFEHFYNSYLL